MTGRPLRILLVGDYADDPRLGSAKVPHKLREEFAAAGHQCDVLFAGDLGARPAGRQLRQLAAPALAFRAIRRALARRNYDVVDAASAEGMWFGAARRLGRWPATVFVCRSNGLEHANYRRMLDDSRAGLSRKPWPRRIWYPASRLSQVAAAARLSDRMIVLNEQDRQFVIGRGWQTPDRIDVVAHGVSSRFLAAPPAAGERGAGVLFCGSWDQVKGIHYLADAFDRLARAGTPVPLTILGPGSDAATVLSAFAAETRRHVTVLDRLPEEAVVAEYRRHDLLVLPSTYEGFALVVIEAMSQGLPVVATPVGCVTQLVADGETGSIVPARDGLALAAAIGRLIASPGDRARFGAAAAARVAGLSWARTARETLAVYEAARSAGRKRAA